MARRSRSEGASRARVRKAAPAGLKQLPFKQWRNHHAPIEVVSSDELEMVHDASLQVLEEIGMNFLLPEAREILKQAGADVDPNSERVRFDRDLIEQHLKTVPSAFDLHARNPAHNLHIGGNTVNFRQHRQPAECDRHRRRPTPRERAGLFELPAPKPGFQHLSHGGRVPG